MSRHERSPQTTRIEIDNEADLVRALEQEKLGGNKRFLGRLVLNLQGFLGRGLLSKQIETSCRELDHQTEVEITPEGARKLDRMSLEEKKQLLARVRKEFLG